MVVSGKILALVMIGAFIFIVGGAVLLVNTHKGRDYNRAMTKKEKMKKICLIEMKLFLKDKKDKFEKFTIEDLEKLSGSYEFIYFPDHIKDMRKPLIVTRKEIVMTYKDFNGELGKFETSIGFFVLFGDTFEVKTYPTSKLKELLDLSKEGNTHFIAEKYYKITKEEALSGTTTKKAHLVKGVDTLTKSIAE